MMIFWLAVAAMIAAALILVLPPLLGRGARKRAVSRRQLNVAVYRDRLAELDAAHEAGELEGPEHRQARLELERALLDDTADAGDDAEAVSPVGPRPVTAVLVAVAVPVLAIGLYLQFGTLHAVDDMSAAAHADAAAAETGQPSVGEMAAELVERLRAEPGDAKGWAMLGRVYAFMKRDDDSRKAFARAVELTPREPTALIGYAETLTRLAQGQVTDEAVSLARRALEVDPSAQPALWLDGMAAFQRGDSARALERWNRIRTLGGLNAQSTKVLDTFIERAGGTTVAAARPEAGSAAVAPGPEGASVQVRVALDPALAAQASGADAVYIYARAAKGPPMPLAVVRKTVEDLPLTVTLSDSMAMVEAMRLSAFPEVVVGARVSRSGAPGRTAGDLEGLTPPVRVAEADVVDVSIDTTVR